MKSIAVVQNQILIDNKPFFIQGMNLFLDPVILETNPRKIYNPRKVHDSLIRKIIPYLRDLGINTVRIWPRSHNHIHHAQISDHAFHLLADAGFYIILNLPVNWNLKPTLNELKTYIKHYSGEIFNNILLYCINNEAYHGFVSPKRYTKRVNKLTHLLGKRPTLLTNANLNYPWLFCADVIGADFFTYKYSISRDGAQDVGAVARMFLEDAQNTYKIFPKSILNYYYLFETYLARKARKKNFDPAYFGTNLLKVLKQTQKRKKPYIIAEYGYTNHAQDLDAIYSHMPILCMQGHIWYNWLNFDEKIQGSISNEPLFLKFKEICEKIKKIKIKQGYCVDFQV